MNMDTNSAEDKTESKAMNKQDFDKIFFENLKSPSHIHFLGFSITINLAFYTVFYFLKVHFSLDFGIPEPTIHYFLTFFLAIFNICAYVVFRREHALDEIIREFWKVVFGIDIKKSDHLSDDEITKLREFYNIVVNPREKNAPQILHEQDMLNKKMTYQAINILYGLLNATSLVYASILVYDFYPEELKTYIFLLFIIFLFFTFGFAYNILCYFFMVFRNSEIWKKDLSILMPPITLLKELKNKTKKYFKAIIKSLAGLLLLFFIIINLIYLSNINNAAIENESITISKQKIKNLTQNNKLIINKINEALNSIKENQKILQIKE